MIRRFAYIKWTGVAVVAITGIVQWLDTYPQVADKQNYLLAFAVKMLGAIGLFLITFLLALPDERLKGMQRHRAFWAGINIACGLTILVGAALMRAVRNGQL
jgi:threonine/homoserine/homoserine lactone efflux protein